MVKRYQGLREWLEIAVGSIIVGTKNRWFTPGPRMASAKNREPVIIGIMSSSSCTLCARS